MKLFGKTSPGSLVFGAAMLALMGKATVSSEETIAANEELTTAGITGASLITEAAYNDLTTTAGRAAAAEASVKATTDALAAAGAADIAALVAQRDGYKVKADKFDKGPGAGHTNPVLPTGTSDVEDTEPNVHKQAIDNLPHNKALDNNPLFAKRIEG